MIKSKNSDLYKRIVNITTNFLGPAAERFIKRKIRNHLSKDPDELTQADVVKLVDKLEVAIAILTEDSETVEEFSKNIVAVSRK